MSEGEVMRDCPERINRLISRRDFTLSLAVAAITPAALRVSAPAAQNSASAERTKQAFAKAIVIDALGALYGGDNMPEERKQEQARMIKESGLTAVNLTVSIGEYDNARAATEYWKNEAASGQSPFLLVEKADDIKRAKQQGKLGLIIGFQDSVMLDIDLDRVDEFHKLGVRVIQLTYNVANLVGDGCLETRNAGLTNFGREVVKRMNALGVALDLSHCGDRTTAEAIELSSRPPLITHTGCRAVYRHPRNKEDRELRAAASRGGVIGIYMMPYLGGTGYATEALFIEHIEHALKVCGEDHVGIGTDQHTVPVVETPQYLRSLRDVIEWRKKNRVAAPDDERPLYIKELNHPRRFETVALAMAHRGHSARVIEKVLGANFLRAFQEIWK
jgi:membrane dipeptidase